MLPVLLRLGTSVGSALGRGVGRSLLRGALRSGGGGGGGGAVRITATSNFDEVAKMIGDLSEDVARKAAARAATRTVEQGRTKMSRDIRADFNLPASTVKDSLQVNKASASKGLSGIEASLEALTRRGRSMNVIRFGARQTKKGVTVQIRKGGGRKVVRNAFIANDGRTVFQRVGKKRFPIRAVQTVGVSQMFNTRRINDGVVRMIEEKYPEIFEREAKFYLSKFNKHRA
ncbi:MAG TPA: phage tail protein [Noviherbaspirillum sp.]|nr:phage tail protein [Noviherbaspirillum sp.]